MHRRQICVAAARRHISDLVSNREYCIAAIGGGAASGRRQYPGDLRKMWHYNEAENAYVGSNARVKTAGGRMTPGEIELKARRIRAAILADRIADLVVAVVRAIGWIASPLFSWWNRTRVYDELMSMDDRMLADIGISRADIPTVAAGRYRSDTSGDGWHVIDRVRRMSRPVLPLAHNDHAAPPRVA